MINHPNEAKAIVQKKLNYTDAYMAKIWPKNEFSLTLDQSLVVAMEDEGRWMIANNLTTAKTIPDIRDHIYTKGLEGVKARVGEGHCLAWYHENRHRIGSNWMKKGAVGAIVVMLVLTGIGAWYFTSSQTAYSGVSEPITIGEFPYEAAALIYTAEDQGFFSRNGLNVTLRDYDSTSAAIDWIVE